MRMNRMRNVGRNSVVAISVTAVAMVLSSCGSDEPAAETAATETEPQTVMVTAIDYAFVDLPSRVKAGTTLALHNDSDAEVHELVAIRLPDDEQRPVAELVQQPPEELAQLFPLVKAVLIAPPSEDGFAVEGTGTLTEPGRYAVICVIPTGADPAEYLTAAAEAEGGPPEVAGGPPHIVQGMFGEIVVEG